MTASGLVEIGSHTVTHPHMSRISHEKKIEEIMVSKAELEKNLSRPIKWFSYPYSDLDTETNRLLKEYGYIGTMIAVKGKKNLFQNDFFLINRQNSFDTLNTILY